MFAKLLKHEFRAVGKTLGILSICVLGAGGIGALIMQLILQNTESENSVMVTVLSVLLLFGIYLGILAYGVGSMIMVYYRFYKNKFTDEGYLTFTLPVSTHQILLSSLLNQFIWVVITFFVIICSFLLMFVPVLLNSDFRTLWKSMQETLTMVQSDLSLLYPSGWLSALYFIGQLAYSSILPMFAITVGSIVAKKHKLLVSIAIGYGVSMGISILSSFLAIADLSFNIESTIAGQYAGSNTTVLIGILMLLLGVGGYFLMHHLIDKKLNL